MYEGTIISPNQKPGDFFQPVGCADPTFTGPSFDIENIVLAGVRLAAATLCCGIPNSYPDVNWDVGIVNLRDNNGNPIPPQWICKRLERYSSCPQHD
jgi:hypothetical protein